MSTSTIATSTACPAPVSPVQTILDDLARRFPHDEGEGRLPVPGDYQDANGEWVDIPNIFKVVGFVTCYSDTDGTDCIEMGESFNGS